MNSFTDYIFDLSENAINAKANSIIIKIKKHKKLKLDLIDNGCGMSRKTLKMVTSPFYTTRSTRPIGLGLSLISLLVQQTNGKLKINSKINRGTHLHITFDHHHIDFPKEGNYGMLIADIVCHDMIEHVLFSYQCKHKKIYWTYQNQPRNVIVNQINNDIKKVEENYEIVS